MALKTFVKVSAVNNLSDARYCAGMEVNMIGFNLEKNNPDYISPDAYNELTTWLSGPQYVGEFENYSAVEIQEALSCYKIDYVEVNSKDIIENLNHTMLPVILKQTIAEAAELPADLDIEYLLISGADAVLSDDNIKLIKQLSQHYQILLGAGVTEENVESVLEVSGAFGIALQGGNELRPGYKDYDELADILEALEVDDLA